MPRESMMDDITAAAVGAIIGGMVGQPVVGAMIAAPLSKKAQEFVQKKYNILGNDSLGRFDVRGDRSRRN